MTFQVKTCHPKKNFFDVFLIGLGTILPEIFPQYSIILFKAAAIGEQVLSGQNVAYLGI
jgi:hypothetical protein